MAAHKHAEVIHAYADGATIQILKQGEWVDMEDSVRFYDGAEYRIKPAEPERVYPMTLMTQYDLGKVYLAAEPAHLCHVIVANAALRHAMDNGQVVTREEFERALGDRDARDLKIAKIVSSDACRFGRGFHSVDQLRALIAEVKP